MKVWGKGDANLTRDVQHDVHLEGTQNPFV